ncbi:MAG: c-type cytochrome [Candidatus Brocadiales bacterium]
MFKRTSLFLVFFFLSVTVYAQDLEDLQKQLEEQQALIESQKKMIESLEMALAEKVPPKIARREVMRKQSVERGKKIYFEKGCAKCHGEEGEGGKGPFLSGVTLKYSEAFLSACITSQAVHHGPKTIMPAFTELSIHEVQDLLNFLDTFNPGREITSGIKGKKLWNKLGCLSCHGEKGEGALTGPSLRGITLKYNYDWIRICITDPTVHHGPKAMMPSFKEVPFSDVEAVIDYMSTF